MVYFIIMNKETALGEVFRDIRMYQGVRNSFERQFPMPKVVEGKDVQNLSEEQLKQALIEKKMREEAREATKRRLLAKAAEMRAQGLQFDPDQLVNDFLNPTTPP